MWTQRFGSFKRAVDWVRFSSQRILSFFSIGTRVGLIFLVEGHLRSRVLEGLSRKRERASPRFCRKTSESILAPPGGKFPAPRIREQLAGLVTEAARRSPFRRDRRITFGRSSLTQEGRFIHSGKLTSFDARILRCRNAARVFLLSFSCRIDIPANPRVGRGELPTGF